MPGRAQTPLRPPRNVPVVHAALAASALALSAPLYAAETAARQRGAHAHGEGTLEVAVDGRDLLVTFTIPAANVVGFEHAPETDAQRRLVDEARRRFRDGAALLLPSPAAGCELHEAEATLGTHADEHVQTHAGHDEDAARHGHATPAGGPGAADGDTHSELHAEYHFRCEQPEALEAIDVRLFDALRDVYAVEAHVVTPRYQGAVELTAKRTTVPLVR